MVLLVYSGARRTLINEKSLKLKISCQTPFKRETNKHFIIIVFSNEFILNPKLTFTIVMFY
jgi:hypothetical protein